MSLPRVIFPAVGWVSPARVLGQGRLAGAVAADEADPVARGDLERRLVQQDAGADAQLDAVGGDHVQVLSEG